MKQVTHGIVRVVVCAAWTLVVVAVLSGTTLAQDEFTPYEIPEDGYSPCCCSRYLCPHYEAGGEYYHCWLVQADALFLTYSNYATGADVPLLFGDATDPKGTEIFNGDDLDPDTAWGPRISITRCLFDTTHGFEVNYFGTDAWSATATRTGTFSVQFPSFTHPPLAPPPSTAMMRLDSEIYSLEGNLRLNSGCWWRLLAGYRWIQFGQDFGLAFTTGALGTSRYSIDVDNHMHGFQLGGEGVLWQRNAMRVEGFVKAGVFANSADQVTAEDAAALGGGTAVVSASGNRTGFFGELGVTGVFQLTGRTAIRGGYQGMWMSGVATALDQLDNVNPAAALATLDASSDVFLHGGFIGLEVSH